MTSQLVTTRAHKEIPSVTFVGRSCLGSYGSMQSGDCFIPGASSLRLSRLVAGQNKTCRQMHTVRLYELEVGDTSRLRLGWAFAPFAGVTRRSTLLCRSWNKLSWSGFGVNGRSRRGTSAIGNLEATGFRHTSNASVNQECDSVVLDIQGMKSGRCVVMVRRLLASDKRVHSVAVSLSTETAAVRLKPSGEKNSKVGSELASRLTESGFTSKPRQTGKAGSIFDRKREEIAKKRDELLKSSWGQLALAWGLGALCFATHATHLLHSAGVNNLMGGTISSYLEACVSLVALLGPGRDLLVDGVNALRRKSPNVSSVVCVGAAAFCAVTAVSLAFPHLNWDASVLDVPVMLLAYVLFGRAMDGQAQAEASCGALDVVSALPTRSRLVVHETGTDERTEEAALTQGLVVGVDSEQLRPGDYVLVHPGEVIPVDGKVIDGTSVVDESVLVGKPLSVHKASGNIVSAGTFNREGPLTVEATAIGAQTAVSNISKHAENVDERDSTMQRLADVLPCSSAFSIMSLSAATFSFWYLVGAYTFPDVLYKDGGALGGSSFLPSLKLTCDVLVVACFCTSLATRISVLWETFVGAKKRPLAGREDFQKLSESVRVDPVLSYKDHDTVAGKHDAGPTREDTAIAETGANGEDTGAKENDVGLVNHEHEAQQPGANGKDSVLWKVTDGCKAEEPATSDARLSLDDFRVERPGPVGEDVTSGNDDAGSLAHKAKVEQLGGSDEYTAAGKDKEGTRIFDKVEEDGVYLVTEKNESWQSNYDVSAEAPGDGYECSAAEENEARSRSVQFTVKEHNQDKSGKQDIFVKKDDADSPSVGFKVEEHTPSEEEPTVEETKYPAVIAIKPEEHGASKQDVLTEKDVAGSLIVESRGGEQGAIELDFVVGKDNPATVVESKAELHKGSEQGLVAGKEDKVSAADKPKVEETRSCKQNLVAEKDHAASPSIGSKAEEHSACEQEELAGERGEEVITTLESKDEEHTASQRDLVSLKDDPRLPTVESTAEEFKQSDKNAQDKRHTENHTERPATKERKRREPTASKSGSKNLSKEGCEPGIKTKRKKKKDPTAPKRALSAFMCFSNIVREDLKRSQPELSFTDTGRVLGEMWQKMSADKKAPFESMAEVDKERYKREMQRFNPGGGKD